MLPWEDFCQESINLDEFLLRELSTWAVFQEVGIPDLDKTQMSDGCKKSCEIWKEIALEAPAWDSRSGSGKRCNKRAGVTIVKHAAQQHHTSS